MAFFAADYNRFQLGGFTFTALIRIFSLYRSIDGRSGHGPYKDHHVRGQELSSL